MADTDETVVSRGTLSAPSVATESQMLPTLPEGERIAGRYRVVSLLGRGGFGEVYGVVDQQAGDAPRALKLYRLGDARSNALEALKGEFELLGTLRHPNLARVYDFGYVGESVAYFTQDLVPAAARFDHAIPKGSLRHPKTLDLLMQLCRALDYLHDRAILHGDIKPSNVLVDMESNELTLLDFGIARAFGPSEGTNIIGTYAYLAPEIVAGRPFDARADLYALGVILYRVVAGRLPFDTKGVELLRQQVEAAVPPLPDGVPDDTRGLVMRLLAKSPDDRYASASELSSEIGRIYGVDVEARTDETLGSYVRAPKLLDADVLLETLTERGRRPERDVLQIVGPMGTGKSRVLREARHRLQLEGRTWIHVRVRRDDREVLERVARRVLSPALLAELSDDDARELQRAYPFLRRGRRRLIAPVDPERAARRQRAAFARALHRLFEKRPGVICFDSVERIGPPVAAQVSEVLAELARHDAVQCVVCGRSVPLEVIGPELATRSLPTELARRLIADVLGDAALVEGSELARTIERGAHSGAWLEEALRHGVETGALERREGAWISHPDRLVARPLPQLFRRRIERVDPEARWLALHLALFERPVTIMALSEMMGLAVPELAAQVQALVRADLARIRHVSGRVEYELDDRFVEATVAVFSGVGRRRAHRRLATWLANQRGTDEIARAAEHRRAAGESRRARALWLRAARLADASGQPLRALRYLEAGQPEEPDLDFAFLRADFAERGGAKEQWAESIATLESFRRRASIGRRVDIDVRRVRHALHVGDSDSGLRICRSALRRAREQGHRSVGELLLLAGHLELGRGRLEAAESWYRKAAAQGSRDDDPVLEARAWQGASLCAMVRGRTLEALEMANAARDAAKGQRDRVLQSEVQRQLGNVLRGLADLRGARTAYRKAVRAARRVGRLDLEAKSLNNLGTVAQFMGDPEEAELALTRSIALKEQIGAFASALLGYNNLAGLLIALGRFADAKPLLERVAQEGVGLIHSIALGNLGDLHAACGQLDVALEHYEAGASHARRSDNAGQTTHALTGLARTLLLRGSIGDLDRAAEAERELRSIAEGRTVAEGTRRWLTTRAMLFDARGEVEASVEAAHRSVSVQDRATGFADLFGTELDARRIYAVCLARAGRDGAARRQHRSCLSRLDRLTRRLPQSAHETFLSDHPLHAAIVRGELEPPRGSAW